HTWTNAYNRALVFVRLISLPQLGLLVGRCLLPSVTRPIRLTPRREVRLWEGPPHFGIYDCLARGEKKRAARPLPLVVVLCENPVCVSDRPGLEFISLGFAELAQEGVDGRPAIVRRPRYFGPAAACNRSPGGGR